MSFYRKTPTYRGKVGKPLAGGGFWYHTSKGEDKRRRRPELNGPMLPYAKRREAILEEIRKRIDGTPYVGIPVNIKWTIQLNDRYNQKSKDIRRMLKDGDLMMVRDGGVQGHLSGKRVSYVTLKRG